MMNRRKPVPLPSKLRIPPHDPSASHGFSIGPASTPDIFAHPPPLLSSDLSSALLRTASRPGGQGKSWDRGEWVGSPTLHVGEGLGTGGHFVEEPESVSEGEEDEVVVEAGVEWLGWALLLVAVASWTVGVWSMMIAPFVDTSGTAVLDALAQDRHYKYLLVFLVPVTLYAVIINWWGLKIFRHA